MERVCFLLRVRPSGSTSTGRATATCGRRCSTRCARRAGATTRCSCATTGCWSATSRPRTSRRRSAAMAATDVNARWQAEMAAVLRRARRRRARAPRGGLPPCLRPTPPIDLGATSGRVVAARCDGGRVELEEVPPLRQPAGAAARRPALEPAAPVHRGARRAAPRRAELDGRRRRHLGRRLRAARRRRPRARPPLPLPRRPHRRDGRARVRARAAPSELYAATGIQTMPINTVFQLLADEGSAGARAPRTRIALVPDLLAYWLCGELANERTNASTTGLLDARSGEWARELIARLGLPDAAVRRAGRARHGARPAARATTTSATRRSTRSPATTPRRRSPPRRCATSTPRSSPAAPGRCSGSSCPSRCSSDAARDANLTNERGVDGTTRLLKNVMGLWLRAGVRAARGTAPRYDELHRLARGTRNRTCRCSTPTTTSSCAPGDMPARIAAACERSGQPAPRRRRRDRAQRSSSRSPASTAACWSGSRRSAAATSHAST